MQRAHKIRMYPTKEQEARLAKTADVTRYVYNWAIAKWKEMQEAYANCVTSERPSAFGLCALWTKSCPGWSKDVSRDALDRAIINVGIAYKRFYSGCSKAPRFHKKGRKDTFYAPNTKAWVRNKLVALPKIGKVKLAENLRYTGKLMSCTVSRYANEWYVSVQVDIPEEHAPCADINSVVGIDVGLKTPATASDGTTLHLPTRVKRLKQQYKRAQRILERKQRTSANHNKQLVKLQKIQRKINNIQTDAVNKFTTTITKNHGVVVVEDLDIRQMKQVGDKFMRRCLAVSVMSDILWQLSYKARSFKKVDKYFASSKTCSACGALHDKLSLSDRQFVCPVCGYTIDRDMNAAINLMHAGRVTPGEPVEPALKTSVRKQEVRNAQALVHVSL